MVRIKELADLTGTTVRTVRHYHDIGLLPVPGLSYGWRDYGLMHVARLTRIRWLAHAGLPLSQVAGMLDGSSEPTPASLGAKRDLILADLNAAVVALEDQMEQLRAQRDQIRRLVESVEREDRLSPMPAAVAKFYDVLEQRADEDLVRRAIRRERDFMEVAFYRGDMPSEVAVLYEGLDDTRLAESLALFGQVAAGSGAVPIPTLDEIEQIARAVVARITRHLGAGMPQVARSIDLDVARRAAELYVRLGDGHERRLQRAIGDALLAAIAEARTR